jgi:hypothetical protein
MRKFFKAVVIIAGIAMVSAAIIQELKKPKGQRDWYGRLGGVIPYEFRPPTPHRIKDAMWNPQDERVMTDTVFGVGWSVNLAALKDRVAQRGNGVEATPA